MEYTLDILLLDVVPLKETVSYTSSTGRRSQRRPQTCPSCCHGLVPYIHLLDRTPTATRVVADDGGVTVVAKIVDREALDGVHLDGATGRHTAISLPYKVGEAVSVSLKAARRTFLPSTRVRVWQRQLMSFNRRPVKVLYIGPLFNIPMVEWSV